MVTEVQPIAKVDKLLVEGKLKMVIYISLWPRPRQVDWIISLHILKVLFSIRDNLMI
jgi:hypothetical protein